MTNATRLETFEDLEALFQSASRWYLHGEHDFQCDISGKMTAIVTANSLSKFHPLLPAALAGLIYAQDRHLDGKYVYGRLAYPLVALLTTGSIVLEDPLGVKHTYVGVSDVRANLQDEKAVYVDGNEVNLTYWPGPGGPTPLVLGQTWGTICVSLSYLDAHYPGFSERWKMAQSLHLEGVTNVSYLFNASQTNIASVEGVVFE